MKSWEKDQGFRPLDGVWCCWWSIIEHTTYTFPKFNILLMVQKSGDHHLGCIPNPVNTGIFYHINWFFPDFWTINSSPWKPWVVGRRSFPFLSLYIFRGRHCATKPFEGFKFPRIPCLPPPLGCHQATRGWGNFLPFFGARQIPTCGRVFFSHQRI